MLEFIFIQFLGMRPRQVKNLTQLHMGTLDYKTNKTHLPYLLICRDGVIKDCYIFEEHGAVPENIL